MSFDINNLIRAVRCREPIWNRQHPQYKDRECSLLLWGQVAHETGVDVETVRCKWRGLRDTFRVQLRKLSQPGRKGPHNPLTWEYFEEMMFVKDQIYMDVNRKKYYPKSPLDDLDPREIEITRTRKHNFDPMEEFKDPADFCITEVKEDPETRLEFNDPPPLVTGSDSLRATVDTTQSFVRREPPTGSSKNILEKKLRALQDDNYCFLMSILPQLKSLPNKQKLYVRIKMQELLFGEVMNLEEPK